MADTKTSGLGALTGSGRAVGDLHMIVDISDTSMAASGTNKKMTDAEMFTSFSATTPALGTPSAGVLTSCTGLPISTGVSGLGANVATALGVAIGSAGAPALVNGVLGTPSSGTLTSCTGLPAAGVVGTAAILTGNTFSGGNIYSAAGANSVPPLWLTGALNVAGTGTTTFPHIFHQPTGATASTTWSNGANAGTVFGANEATGFTGNFFEFRTAGTALAKLTSAGAHQVADGSSSVCAYGFAANVNSGLVNNGGAPEIYQGGTRRAYFGNFVLFESGLLEIGTNANSMMAEVAGLTRFFRAGATTTSAAIQIDNTASSAAPGGASGAGSFETLRIDWSSNVARIYCLAGSGGGTLRGVTIGSAITDLVSLYGVTPIAQRAGAAQAAVVTTASTQTTPFGYATQAQADSIVTLVNELRAWAVAFGAIKGAA